MPQRLSQIQGNDAPERDRYTPGRMVIMDGRTPDGEILDGPALPPEEVVIGGKPGMQGTKAGQGQGQSRAKENVH